MPRNRSARLIFALIVLLLLGLIGRNTYRRYLSSRLLAAVETGNAAAIRSLLARGADPNSYKMESIGNTRREKRALSLALDVSPAPFPEQEAVACLLIQYGADLSNGRGDGWLQSACEKGSIVVERSLLEHGVAPDAQDTNHRTPLDTAINYTSARAPFDPAIRFGRRRLDPSPALLKTIQAKRNATRMEMIRVLRAHGAQLNLWQAARINDTDALRVCLDAGTPVDAGERTDSYITGAGDTALTLAAREGNYNAARLLLERSANVNIEYRNTTTPLAAAVQGGHLEVARLLLQHHADVNSLFPTSYPVIVQACSTLPQLVPELLQRGAGLKDCGDQALNTALQNNHPELAALLLPAYARQGGKIGRSVLQAALQYQPGLVPLLLAQGADARETAREDNGLLWYALHFRRKNLIRPLLRAGANVNARACNITPLMEALRNGTDTVNLLLTNGADPNRLSWFKLPPLVIAAQAGDVETVRTLLKHGAAVNGSGKIQHTPLYYARRHNHSEVTSLLQQAGGKD